MRPGKFSWISAAIIAAALALGAGSAAVGASFLPAGTAIAPVDDRAPAPTASDVEQADLVAQTRMAEAADAMVSLTGWQLAIGAVGTVGVIASLYFSAQATNAGFRAAKAAEDALASQERPRMMVDQIALAPFAPHPNAPDILQTLVTLTHKNHGTGFGWLTGHAFKIEAVEILKLAQKVELIDRQMLWPIAPGNWWGYKPEHEQFARIPADDLKAVEAGASMIVLHGRLSYQNLTGAAFELRYAYIQRKKDGEMVPLAHPIWMAT